MRGLCSGLASAFLANEYQKAVAERGLPALRRTKTGGSAKFLGGRHFWPRTLCIPGRKGILVASLCLTGYVLSLSLCVPQSGHAVSRLLGKQLHSGNLFVFWHAQRHNLGVLALLICLGIRREIAQCM